MIVYRVELDNGSGPYIIRGEVPDEAYDLSNELVWAHNDEEHPAPFAEGLPTTRGCRKDMYCGFASREALVEWFAGYGDKLRKAGHKVSAYLVDDGDVEIGERQVTFVRGDLTPFARVDVGEVFAQ